MTDVTPIVKYSKAFWIDLADRAVSTGAQAALGLATAAGFNLLHPDPAAIAAVIGTAVIISVLKALAVQRGVATFAVKQRALGVQLK